MGDGWNTITPPAPLRAGRAGHFSERMTITGYKYTQNNETRSPKYVLSSWSQTLGHKLTVTNLQKLFVPVKERVNMDQRVPEY